MMTICGSVSSWHRQDVVGPGGYLALAVHHHLDHVEMSYSGTTIRLGGKHYQPATKLLFMKWMRSFVPVIEGSCKVKTLGSRRPLEP